MLVTWELGGGLGHWGPIRAIAAELLKTGYEVSIAARDLFGAGAHLTHSQVRLFQAPHRVDPFRRPFETPQSYAHMLHNVGLGDEVGLLALVKAWREVIHSSNAEVVICEHSPIAMLACYSLQVPIIAMGTGFTLPPSPLPLLRPDDVRDQSQLVRDTDNTLNCVNRVAKRFCMAPLDDLSEIYTRADAQYLLTYPELDHFGPRTVGVYVGAELSSLEKTLKIEWPSGSGPKIFAYLKLFPGLDEAVHQLAKLDLPTIVFCPGLNTHEQTILNKVSRSLRVTSNPVDIDAIMQSAAIGICHGGHGLVAQLLMAGIPLVTFPLQLEQQLLCQRIANSSHPMGICISQGIQIREAVTALLDSDLYRLNAQRFAEQVRAGYESTGIDRIANSLAS